MSHLVQFRGWRYLVGAAALCLGAVVVHGQQQSARPPADPTKRRAESGATRVARAAAAPRADRGKHVAEAPTESVVHESRSAFVNPPVEPGKIRWHADRAAALAAACKSHKPVLLFQMMGKLDDQFC